MESKITIKGFWPRRLRARTVENPEQIVLDLLKNNRRGIHIFSGGGITAKSYKYKAETEVLLVIVLSSTEYFAEMIRYDAKKSQNSFWIFKTLFPTVSTNPFKDYKHRDEMILNKKLALIALKKIYKKYLSGY